MYLVNFVASSIKQEWGKRVHFVQHSSQPPSTLQQPRTTATAVLVKCTTTIFVWHAHISAQGKYFLIQLMHTPTLVHTHSGWTASLEGSWAQ